ncbi:MAG: DUF2723 domain-containing protein [Winogradskyella sp.]|uniref:glycosyltransferase family 117 protein n=1 Tax=Winogradskyella sp. TaxID=1883156 RepID=UPI0025DAB1C7|nr:DUF2723 domain-containing protein [Winogradskyella sp.]NRB82720.1 DUF2723 domain-containing protein [Winogradskyella sp.]
MTYFNFKKWNTILAWFAFAVAFITYALTIEPTVSFWDAGEYILTSSKLQVGHPPGAPLFQMLGAFFSMFALEPEQIGMIMNLMSATASAFTILFMFWTISMLLVKLVKYDKNSNANKGIAVLGSALAGALSFTFTDSFWFNAVETEVYAMATLIMSVMFYLALRWEQDMLKPRGNRWLILIAFIIGLSFGVHFMGLLTIPAIGLIYYFKNYKTITIKNFIIANIASAAILLFIFKLLLPSTLKLFGNLEVFFVNSIGLPFNSGTIITGLMVIGLFYFGLNYTRKKGLIHINTLVLCLMFIFMGFSSWMMLPIRANANVIINENNPSDARELLAYYNLEQYPETHLFYGPQFTEIYSGADEDKPFVDDKKNYERDDELGEYVIINQWEGSKQNYNHDHASILPRMWSSEHAENYMMFTGLINFKVNANVQTRAYNEAYNAFMQDALKQGLSETEADEFVSEQAGQYAIQEKRRIDQVVNKFRNDIRNGEVDYEGYDRFLRNYGQQYLEIEKPSFTDNLAYMFQYQFGYMYWRYFMWNFTGRQNDIQGKYDDFNGNWISGIKFIDELHLGVSQDNLPTEVLENKARNTYYFLPLILGLIGFFFLMYTDAKRFWVLLVFFLLTGLAIQFYTNIRPFEPRERDYSVVGSFYVFAIWIGFGVYAIYDLLKTRVKSQLLAPVITLVCIIIIPGILAANNWDDHDRSGKYTANAMARKYLESCAPNSILFTIGDNDSFPLWYLQEIEGVRTDVRVVNTSLFQTDWYIDQMKRKAYESDPIPSQLTHKQYRGGNRDVIIRREITKDTLSIKDFMDFVSSEKPTTKFKYVLERQGEDPRQYPNHLLSTNYFPTRHISIPVNKETVLKNGIVKSKDADKIEDNLYAEIEGSYIYKNRLLMLDIIANNNWERPIYFTGGAFGADDYVWLKDYLQLDGMCYKLVPIKTPVDRANPYDMGRVDPDLMYDMVKTWDWGGSGEDIYHDIETRRNGITFRGNLARLIESLINEDKLKEAEEIADIAMEKMPVDKFGFHSLLEPYISAYYEVGNKEKGRALFKEVSKIYQENILYYGGLDKDDQIRLIEDIYLDIQRYRALVDILFVYQDKEFAMEEMKKYNNFLSLLDEFLGPDEEDVEPLNDIDINTILKDSIQDTIAPEE